jgi:cytochrome b561
MSVGFATKYDRTTLSLHGLLATGIVIQLILSAVMRVPAGPGLGVRDWHREAFEIHAKVGLAVVFLCLLHWIWICLPFSRPGVVSLVPWLRRDQRSLVAGEFRNLLRGQIPSSNLPSPLAGTVHGLGLLAVTGSAVGGVVNYLGYFLGEPIPHRVLHWVGRVHISLGYVIWAFVIAHVTMALLHRLKVGDMTGGTHP